MVNFNPGKFIGRVFGGKPKSDSKLQVPNSAPAAVRRPSSLLVADFVRHDISSRARVTSDESRFFEAFAMGERGVGGVEVPVIDIRNVQNCLKDYFKNNVRDPLSRLEVQTDGLPLKPGAWTGDKRDAYPILTAQATGREVHILESERGDSYSEALVLPSFNPQLPGENLSSSDKPPIYLLRDGNEYSFLEDTPDILGRLGSPLANSPPPSGPISQSSSVDRVARQNILPATQTRMTVIKADITTIKADAIVNAANTGLQSGGGVCGAIFTAAGNDARQLQDACDAQGPCAPGDAKITSGTFGSLNCEHVIHAVGPDCREDHQDQNRDTLLGSAYKAAIKLADAAGCKSIAFPAISVGIYKFPADQATNTVVEAVKDAVKACTNLNEVIFSCFDDATEAAYNKKLAETTAPAADLASGDNLPPSGASSVSSQPNLLAALRSQTITPPNDADGSQASSAGFQANSDNSQSSIAGSPSSSASYQASAASSVANKSVPPESRRTLPIANFTLHNTDKTSGLDSFYQAFVMGEQNSGGGVAATDFRATDLRAQMVKCVGNHSSDQLKSFFLHAAQRPDFQENGFVTPNKFSGSRGSEPPLAAQVTGRRIHVLTAAGDGDNYIESQVFSGFSPELPNWRDLTLLPQIHNQSPIYLLKNGDQYDFLEERPADLPRVIEAGGDQDTDSVSQAGQPPPLRATRAGPDTDSTSQAIKPSLGSLSGTGNQSGYLADESDSVSSSSSDSTDYYSADDGSLSYFTADEYHTDSDSVSTASSQFDYPSDEYDSASTASSQFDYPSDEYDSASSVGSQSGYSADEPASVRSAESVGSQPEHSADESASVTSASIKGNASISTIPLPDLPVAPSHSLPNLLRSPRLPSGTSGSASSNSSGSISTNPLPDFPVAPSHSLPNVLTSPRSPSSTSGSARSDFSGSVRDFDSASSNSSGSISTNTLPNRLTAPRSPSGTLAQPQSAAILSPASSSPLPTLADAHSSFTYNNLLGNADRLNMNPAATLNTANESQLNKALENLEGVFRLYIDVTANGDKDKDPLSKQFKEIKHKLENLVGDNVVKNRGVTRRGGRQAMLKAMNGLHANVLLALANLASQQAVPQGAAEKGSLTAEEKTSFAQDLQDPYQIKYNKKQLAADRAKLDIRNISGVIEVPKNLYFKLSENYPKLVGGDLVNGGGKTPPLKDANPAQLLKALKKLNHTFSEYKNQTEIIQGEQIKRKSARNKTDLPEARQRARVLEDRVGNNTTKRRGLTQREGPVGMLKAMNIMHGRMTFELERLANDQAHNNADAMGGCRDEIETLAAALQQPGFEFDHEKLSATMAKLDVNLSPLSRAVEPIREEKLIVSSQGYSNFITDVLLQSTRAIRLEDATPDQLINASEHLAKVSSDYDDTLKQINAEKAKPKPPRGGVARTEDRNEAQVKTLTQKKHKLEDMVGNNMTKKYGIPQRKGQQGMLEAMSLLKARIDQAQTAARIPSSAGEF
jgi:O-acetyl-ADP-ribose deacetylase (regulator of RNase III)